MISLSLFQWATKWQLQFNTSLSVDSYILVIPIHILFIIYMNYDILAKVSELKGLGVAINNKLNFHSQTALVVAMQS